MTATTVLPRTRERTDPAVITSLYETATDQRIAGLDAALAELAADRDITVARYVAASYSMLEAARTAGTLTPRPLMREILALYGPLLWAAERARADDAAPLAVQLARAQGRTSPVLVHPETIEPTRVALGRDRWHATYDPTRDHVVPAPANPKPLLVTVVIREDASTDPASTGTLPVLAR